VIAKWTARAGEEERVRAALIKLTPCSRSEIGCRFYQPTQDPEDPRVFLLLEIYDDRAAYDAHAGSDHFRQHALEHAIPLLANRERSFYETVDPD